MPRTWITAALLAATACSSEPSPTAVTDPVPDMGLSAFKLTIDVPSGRITVAPPVRASGVATNASFSLIGSEAVALHASTCTWSTTPGNSKQKRCRFDLAIENRLAGVDLRTPTTFPQPPAGTTGILVFPFTAASLGTPSNAATPTTDWNNAPTNFFNDFGGCVSGKTNDCYRSETYASPLFAGQSSEARTVGFDVDKNAQTVVTYVAVAADIRDVTPPVTVTLAAGSLCGTLFKLADGTTGVAPGILGFKVGGEPGSADFRSVCSFTLPNDVGRITHAIVRFYQEGELGADPFASGNTLVLDHVDYGQQIDGSLYDQAALAANIGTLSTDGTVEFKELDVTSSANDDAINGRAASQFRLRFRQEPALGEVALGIPNSANGPELVVTYRVR